MDKVDVIIPVRNKERDRLKKVVNRIKGDRIGEIIIVDYCSDEPVKHIEGVKIIRYEKSGPWNKAHAINIGFKRSKSKYIITLDADILLEDKFEKNLVLSEDSYCYSGDVRRILKNQLDKDFKKMWKNSKPWRFEKAYDQEMYGSANGGLQLYPRKLLEEWNGIDENLVYSGGMDNITNLMAKKIGMKVIQLPIKLLHIEHSNKKFMNYPEDEQLLAQWIGSMRGDYLNNWINEPSTNKFCGRLSGPCYTTYLKQVEWFKENKEDLKRKSILINNREKKIIIAIINNNNLFDYRFMKGVFDLYLTTSSMFPNTDLRFIKACQVNHMRNIAVTRSIVEKYDYLIQLDTDHLYEPDTIIRLIADDKDFVTVPTKMRVSPFLPTQFYKFTKPIKSGGNAVIVTGDETELIKIECSGPVAMLMKVEALKKLDFPYYYMDYSNGIDKTMGGDFIFCKQLKDKGFDLYLNPTINCNHFVRADVSSFGEDAEVSLDNGTM